MNWRVALAAAVASLCVFVAVGCGGGSTTVQRTVTVTTATPAAAQSLVYARRRPGDHPREAGEHSIGPLKCPPAPGGRVKTVHVVSIPDTCVRVSPRDRLLFVNSTGIGADHREPNPVEVTLGPYEASLGVGQSGLFPAAVGSYLGLGLHEAGTSATAQQPFLLVLPEGCAIADPAPGDGLCFAAGAPPCPRSALSARVGRTGAAAGTIYQRFALVNRSSRTCTVSGFPRVTALDAAGRQIGAPGTVDHALTTGTGKHTKRLALPPEGIAFFEMRYGEALNYAQPCGIRKSRTLRVAIPAGPSRTLPYRLELCRRQGFSVGRIE